MIECTQTLLDAGAQRSDWQGFECLQLERDQMRYRFVFPEKLAQGKPWFWRPEFFGAFANADIALLKRGWTLAFLDLPDHYGCPRAIHAFNDLHTFVSAELGMADKVGILALSRAGLSAYHFASNYPDKVCALYADNPVCDFRSWPGGLGHGPGSRTDWKNLLSVYSLNDAEARGYEQQPHSGEVLRPIAALQIPVLHVCGDSDETVPFEENTAVLRQRLLALGGDYREIIIPGGKHHPHGLPDPSPIVDFFEDAFASYAGDINKNQASD